MSQRPIDLDDPDSSDDDNDILTDDEGDDNLFTTTNGKRRRPAKSRQSAGGSSSTAAASRTKRRRLNPGAVNNPVTTKAAPKNAKGKIFEGLVNLYILENMLNGVVPPGPATYVVTDAQMATLHDSLRLLSEAHVTLFTPAVVQREVRKLQRIAINELGGALENADLVRTTVLAVLFDGCRATVCRFEFLQPRFHASPTNFEDLIDTSGCIVLFTEIERVQ